ncbi:hypothetical protein [uncultured Ferrimonas sp.]|uniref:hypothetical protein n=1 Tax=uncultured Ferrimonas sp. TaxID=432640 RepID=UPI002617BB46|nr:hypothetical protein [uncultured Ferrimonas sp.]
MFATEKARAIEANLLEIIGQWNAILSQGISADELALFKSIQTRMIANASAHKTLLSR